MRLIATLFSKSSNFDEQWILFKAYLNTVHSLSDNDRVARDNFHQNEVMNFVLLLRNLLHHQPAKWHFGKHDVQPTALSLNFFQNSSRMSAELSLVIEKATLEGQELQQILGANSPKQLAALRAALGKINSHVIVVFSLMKQAQELVEQFCKEQGKYTEPYDDGPGGYRISQHS